MATDKEIEAAAKAIFEDDFDADIEWSDPQVYHDHYRSLAHVALTAAEQVRAGTASNFIEMVSAIDSRIQGKKECLISAEEWLKISNVLCAEQVKAGEWQPISTKPSLLHCEERGEYKTDDGQLWHFKPTHWRPLTTSADG